MEAQSSRVTNDSCLAAYGKTSPRLTSECVAPPNDQHVVALIGDSHAATLAPALRSIAGRSGYGFEEIGKSSCPPLQSVAIYMPNHPGHDRECAAFNTQTLSYLRNNPRIDIVVIAGFWASPFSQPEEDFSYVRIQEASKSVPLEVSRENLQYGLEKEVEELRSSGKRIILMKDAAELDVNPVQYEIAKFIPARRRLGELLSPTYGLTSEYALGRANAYDDRAESSIIDVVATKYPDVHLYDLKKKLCAGADCAFVSRGSLLYIDSHHLSEAGAAMTLADLTFADMR